MSCFEENRPTRKKFIITFYYRKVVFEVTQIFYLFSDFSRKALFSFLFLRKSQLQSINVQNVSTIKGPNVSCFWLTLGGLFEESNNMRQKKNQSIKNF